MPRWHCVGEESVSGVNSANTWEEKRDNRSRNVELQYSEPAAAAAAAVYWSSPVCYCQGRIICGHWSPGGKWSGSLSGERWMRNLKQLGICVSSHTHGEDGSAVDGFALRLGMFSWTHRSILGEKEQRTIASDTCKIRKEGFTHFKIHHLKQSVTTRLPATSDISKSGVGDMCHTFSEAIPQHKHCWMLPCQTKWMFLLGFLVALILETDVEPAISSRQKWQSVQGLDGGWTQWPSVQRDLSKTGVSHKVHPQQESGKGQKLSAF